MGDETESAMLRFHALIALAAVTGFVLSSSSAPAMGPRRYHEGETQRGMASWYGSENGRHTSSGERFDPGKLTAAHRHLPFGTIVRVTNRMNGLSVEVRINDRGPFGDGDRIIDLSSAAADVLQMKKAGIVPVEIEVVELPSPGGAN
jgi:rare lipoprotein A